MFQKMGFVLVVAVARHSHHEDENQLPAWLKHRPPAAAHSSSAAEQAAIGASLTYGEVVVPAGGELLLKELAVRPGGL